jgi:hypothetical protein
MLKFIVTVLGIRTIVFLISLLSFGPMPVHGATTADISLASKGCRIVANHVGAGLQHISEGTDVELVDRWMKENAPKAGYELIMQNIYTMIGSKEFNQLDNPDWDKFSQMLTNRCISSLYNTD